MDFTYQISNTSFMVYPKAQKKVFTENYVIIH